MLTMIGIVDCAFPFYVVAPKCAVSFEREFRAKQRLYSGSRVVSYGFRAYLSRAPKFSFLLSSATQATSPCVAELKAVASLEMVMQGLQTLRFG